MCLQIFIHAFRHFRWQGGGWGQWPCLFRQPHQVQGHFLWPWNFIYNLRNLLYLSGRSWFQFSIRVPPSATDPILIIYLFNLKGIAHLEKKNHLLFTWEKNVLNKQYVSWGLTHSLFLDLIRKHKENDLHRKLTFLGGSAENASSPTILQIE